MLTKDSSFILLTQRPQQGFLFPNTPRRYLVNGVYSVAENGDDLAILLTSSDENFPPKIEFGGRKPQDYASKMRVAVISYPGDPKDMTPWEKSEFFRTPITKTPQFGYKRLSGGNTGAEAVTPNGLFKHYANTAGGSSGSPVFDLKDATPVGLHVGGHPRFPKTDILGRNEALTSERVIKLLTDSGLSRQ
jgi:V8-like Glu-specific endopeptidase